MWNIYCSTIVYLSYSALLSSDFARFNGMIKNKNEKLLYLFFMFLRVKKCCKKLKKIVVKCSFLNISSLGLSSRVWLNAKLDLGLDSVALAAASTMTSDKTATSLIMATKRVALLTQYCILLQLSCYVVSQTKLIYYRPMRNVLLDKQVV